jgi:hypothetical protein
MRASIGSLASDHMLALQVSVEAMHQDVPQSHQSDDAGKLGLERWRQITGCRNRHPDQESGAQGPDERCGKPHTHGQKFFHRRSSLSFSARLVTTEYFTLYACSFTTVNCA